MTTAREAINLATSERDFQGFVVAYAQMRGWMVWHDNDSRGNVPGWPDLVLVRDGALIFAELKSEKGIVSKAQQAWLAALGGVEGVVTHVWRPTDAEQVMEVLR